MSVSQHHPLYDLYAPDWEQMRITYQGERAVKEEGGMRYLPPTPGMVEDGAYDEGGTSAGYRKWLDYRTLAAFPDLVRDAVRTAVGVIHREPAKVELPRRMDRLRERATWRGETLDALHRRITLYQLVYGRCGLLLDVPTGVGVGDALPYVAIYPGPSIINWDDGAMLEEGYGTLTLVVLNETAPVRSDYSWTERERYRVLRLGALNREPGAPIDRTYSVQVFDGDDDAQEAEDVTPSIGGRRFDEIPFEFVNACDLSPEPEAPVFLGVSNAALTIYRADASYRRSLIVSGDDTLFIEGDVKGHREGTPLRTGAGSLVHLTQGSRGYYVGVDSSGLPEKGKALENDHNRASSKAGELLDAVSRERESGEALRTRTAARTASLTQVSITSAYALQSMLRRAARILGLDPEEVVIAPNLDFDADLMPAQELTGLVSARMMGAPISLRTIHEQMQDRGLTRISFEEEVERIEQEESEGVGETMRDAVGAVDPDGPVPDEEGEDDEGGASDGGRRAARSRGGRSPRRARRSARARGA